MDAAVSEIELHYRSKIKAKDRYKITRSQDAARLLKLTWDPAKIDFVEQFKVLLLNRAHQVIGMLNVSSGTTASTVVDMKLIFVAGMKCNASGIIIAHNHPSGNLNPSETDKSFTRKVRDAGKLLEIQLLVHIIVTSEGHYSFADEGAL